jgi:NAD(P)-dependent dehydrogenase (short-subunit alcohol dehydrogenase family)
MAEGNILVTGASSGIGRACAVRLAALGYRVFAGVRNASAGEDLKALAPAIEPVRLDVTQPALIQGAMDAVHGEPLAGLVNNAGISLIGPLELLTLDTWRRQYEVNVMGLVAVTQAFLPHLRRGRGRIVNIGSVAGRSALPGTGAYDSSKFAVEAITDSLRMELRPFGIRVSIVEPGAVATEIWEKTLRATDDLTSSTTPELKDLYGHLISKIREETVQAAGKALPPEAVAKAVQHAITSRRPKTRYVIGADARLWLLLNLLPDTWRDRLILSNLSK